MICLIPIQFDVELAQDLDLAKCGFVLAQKKSLKKLHGDKQNMRVVHLYMCVCIYLSVSVCFSIYLCFLN